MQKLCNLGVERHFWYKDGSQRSVQAPRATSVVEGMVIGFAGPSNATSRAPFQMNFAEENDKAENLHLVPKVQKPFYFNHKVTSCFAF